MQHNNEEINQCDGCQRGLLMVGEMHQVKHKSGAISYEGCTKERYISNNKEKCKACGHEICPKCKNGCHNTDCEAMARPFKSCFDLLKPAPQQEGEKEIVYHTFKGKEYCPHMNVKGFHCGGCFGVSTPQIVKGCKCDNKKCCPHPVQQWEERIEEESEKFLKAYNDFIENCGEIGETDITDLFEKHCKVLVSSHETQIRESIAKEIEESKKKNTGNSRHSCEYCDWWEDCNCAIGFDVAASIARKK